MPADGIDAATCWNGEFGVRRRFMSSCQAPNAPASFWRFFRPEGKDMLPLERVPGSPTVGIGCSMQRNTSLPPE